MRCSPVRRTVTGSVRLSSNGRASAFQADDRGSIPRGRSRLLLGKRVWSSGRMPAFEPEARVRFPLRVYLERLSSAIAGTMARARG